MDTLSSLREEVLQWLDESGDTDGTKTKVDNALNHAHASRLTETPWPFMLWDGEETFSFVSGIQSYSLHSEFLRPAYFYNRATNQFLVETPMRALPGVGNWREDTSGRAFSLWGYNPVTAQPTSSSVLTIVSTSSSDTGAAKAVIVRGDTGNGVTTDTITPNGTTPVAGVIAFTKILSISKSTAWVGTATITSNSAAITNLTLFPAELARQYPRLITQFVPGSADTIGYRFYRRPSSLTNDSDIPDIPSPFGKVLVWDALLLLAAYDGQAEGSRTQIWRDNQSRLETAMRHALLEGQSLESTPRTIRMLDSDF